MAKPRPGKKTGRTRGAGTDSTPRSRKPKTAPVNIDQSDPRYLKLESIVRRGVLFENMTAESFWATGKAYCKEAGFSGFSKGEAHRMHDYYRKGLEQAKLQGEFHVELMKLASQETDLRHRMLELCSKFTSNDISDIRDHVSDYDMIHTGNGAPWRAKVVEVVDKLATAGYDVSGVTDLVEVLCPKEVEQSALPEPKQSALPEHTNEST